MPPIAGKAAARLRKNFDERPSNLSEALLVMLERDLRRGYRNLAIRHFLMLDACKVNVPRELEADCRNLIRQCDGTRLASTEQQVELWARMVLR